MGRIVLKDGRWFDGSKARKWDEDTRWDGHNNISVATGSQWEHEMLYRTAGGVYVLHSYSQWQGVADRYTEITPAQAAVWLAINAHGSEADGAGVGPEFASLEIK